MAPRRRLDAELVRRQLVGSRTEAQVLIGEHRVLVNGSVADKASRQVSPADAVLIDGPAGTIRRTRRREARACARRCSPSTCSGLRALDAGASTGGFTDCLLQRGASHVVALDVGHGQLHERLRADPRVTNLERCNVRHATAEQIGGRVDIVVGDLSFISLRVVIPSLVALCQPGRPMVLLVKPQFEAGRAEVSKGKGVITDPDVSTIAFVTRWPWRSSRRAAMSWDGPNRRSVAPTAMWSTWSTRSRLRRGSRDHRGTGRSSLITNASWRAISPTKAAAWCAARDVDVWMPAIDADAIDAKGLAVGTPDRRGRSRAEPGWRRHDAAQRPAARRSVGAVARREPRRARLPDRGRSRPRRRGARPFRRRCRRGPLASRRTDVARRDGERRGTSAGRSTRR